MDQIEEFYEKVASYYKENHISALEFNCPFQGDCRAAAKAEMSTAKEPYIGSEYAKGAFPRLLFISLDAGWSSKNPEDKVIKSVTKEGYYWRSKGSERFKNYKVCHWWKTHEFANKLFNRLKEEGILDCDVGKYSLDDESWLKKTGSYFAHTNSAKCSFNFKGNSSAPNRLFKNCRSFILGEIEVLKPDVIVSQGNPPIMTIERYIKDGKIKVKQSENISSAGSYDDFHLLDLNGQGAIWITNYHPNCYGRFKKNRDAYDDYFDRISKFLKER
jgi:uracil-DNA glycosylase